MKKGWIKSIRKFKGMSFATATDGSKDFQITVKKDSEVIGELKIGASFIAEGVDSTTPRGLYEFLVSKITIVGKSDDEYPIQPKYHTMDFLRTIPDQRGRSKILQATWKIRHHLTQAIHRFLEEEGFYQYYTPIITDADCEGAGDVFEVSSSWMSQGLTVSGQLHGEVGMMSLGKIYTFSPCFRAEKSSTKKHLSEFWMIEPEMAFFDLKDTVEFSEKFVKSILKYVTDKCEYEFEQLGIDTSHIEEALSSDWLQLKYEDVVKEFKPQTDDIDTETEKKLISKYKSPVFITHYPEEIKPFYMKKKEDKALCFDLIFPEVGELIGGSQREEDIDVLSDQMDMQGLDKEKMDWYLSTRKWGTVPHSGFGIGFERLMMFICKSEKVHDVIPFPMSY